MDFSKLEIAKIFGQPLDPRRPYTDLVSSVCETDTAAPEDYYYYFDALLETDKVVITNTANGIVNQTNVSPDTPALITFVPLATDAYYINIKDLGAAKEKTIARKLKTINRALNEEENYQVIQLLASATNSSGYEFALRSGQKRFIFSDLLDMVDQLADYGSEFVLVAASQIDKDIKGWVYDDNKYASLTDAMKDLQVNKIVRIGTPHKVTRDGSATQVLASHLAYLVAVDAEAGKPGLFVRRRLSEMEMIGGLIKEVDAPDSRSERLVIAGNTPINVGSTRYLAIEITGYEEYASAVTNIYSCAEYSRT